MADPVVSSDETFQSELQAALAGGVESFHHFSPQFPTVKTTATMYGQSGLQSGLQMARSDCGDTESFCSEGRTAAWQRLPSNALRIPRISLPEPEHGPQQRSDLGELEELAAAPASSSRRIPPALNCMRALQQDLIAESEAQQKLEDFRCEVDSTRRRQERHRLEEEAAVEALDALCQRSQRPATTERISDSESSKDALERLLRQLRYLREETRTFMDAKVWIVNM
ncbi:unnamed protein product [Symbiodinium natans]|uniref:Uncharacterized protein n=1 Tax=Symbiodinium natans TaxID=878477 RepID=A0A812L6I4_9DINO|nr:unnamed protein product [Symbiodinium natans]